MEKINFKESWNKLKYLPIISIKRTVVDENDKRMRIHIEKNKYKG